MPDPRVTFTRHFKGFPVERYSTFPKQSTIGTPYSVWGLKIENHTHHKAPSLPHSIQAAWMPSYWPCRCVPAEHHRVARSRACVGSPRQYGLFPMTVGNRGQVLALDHCPTLSHVSLAHTALLTTSGMVTAAVMAPVPVKAVYAGGW